MARFANQAEYYRHHRKCFALAIELGVTPREAELELERRAVQERFAATHRRYLAAKAFPLPREPEAPATRDEPWMMRD